MSGVIAAAGVTAAAGLGGALLTPKGGGTTTASQAPTVPEWVNQGAMQNYGDITKASYNMAGPYTGDTVANLTPEQQNLIQQLYGNVGSTNAAYDTASGKANALLNFSGGQLHSQYLRDANLQPYMNPYTQAIIDPSMQLIEQQRRQALNQTGATAAQTGAFGGSRQGVQEGVTNAQTALQAGQLGANLYSQNFLNAQQQAAGDIGRNWQQQTANLASRQFDANFQAARADQIAALASGKQASWLAGVQPALAGQEAQRQISQQELTAAQQSYDAQRMDEYNRAMMRGQALTSNANLVGRGSETTTPTGTSTSPLMAGLGTASTVAGLFGTLGKSGIFDSSTSTTPSALSGYTFTGSSSW
jgi:hypothetical protein